MIQTKIPHALFRSRASMVHALFFVLAAALCIALTLTSSPSLAAAKSEATLSFSATTTVEKGKTAQFTGKLRKSSNGKAVAKASIRIQRLDGKSWKTVKTVKTNSKGDYKTSVKITSTAKFRASYNGAKSVKARNSAAKTVTVGYTPVLSGVAVAGGKSVDSGNSKTFKGQVQKQLSGVTVQVQRKSGKKWSTLNSGKVSSQGTFSVSARITGGGSATMRVYVPKQAKTTKAASKELTLTIWRWKYLSDMEEKDSYVFRTGSYDVSGRNYSSSVSIRTGGASNSYPGFASYNLSRKCSTFRASVGIDDEESSKSRATARVNIDGTRVKTLNIKWGTTTDLDIDLTSALELEVAAVPWSSYYEGDLVYGNARVRCAA